VCVTLYLYTIMREYPVEGSSFSVQSSRIVEKARHSDPMVLVSVRRPCTSCIVICESETSLRLTWM
jgi:hypothetical protein